MVEQEILDGDLKSVINHMEIAYNQLKAAEGPAVALADFKLANFWCNLCLSCKKLSAELTKLSLIYGKAPLPTPFEAKELFQAIDAAFVDVLATFYTLAKDQGLSMYKVVHESVVEVIGSVVAVMKSLHKNNSQAQKDRLKLTGLAWEACEAVEELPQNNLAAILKLVQNEEALVADATQEIVEEVTSDSPQDEDSPTWSEQDRLLMPSCIGLVKTARSCLKKIKQALQTNGMCSTSEQVTQLDDIARIIAAFSPAVDDFIAAIYPPISRSQVHDEASTLVSLIQQVLTVTQTSHYVKGEDHCWIEFLFKAVYHNDKKLQPLLVA